MAMTRAQLRRAAIIAKCKAAKDKPLERRRVKSFMEPITKAQKAMQTLQVIEDRMTRCTWNEVASAVDTTRIEIELERLGLKRAA